MSDDGTAGKARGWALAPLGELGKWYGGGTPSKSSPSFWQGGTIPWVSPKDMKVGLLIDSQDHITEEAVEASAAKLIPSGSILFVTRSGILAHTFPVALTATNVTVNQDLKALTPHKGIAPQYIAWAARAFGMQVLRECSKDGTTVASIDTGRLHAFELPIAPLPEQHRIVEAIESYFSRLEEAVATLERVQRNLERYRASALKAAVEGRLVPTEAELARAEGRDYEPASVLLERILAERRRRWEEAELEKMTAKGKAPTSDKWKAKYKEHAAPDTSDLPELPEGWCWATGGQLSEVITKGSSPRWQGFEYVTEGIPFVRSQNVRWGQLDLTDLAKVSVAFNKKEAKSVLRSGDILVNIVGASIGRAAVATELVDGGNTNQAVAILRPARTGFAPEFGCLYVISPAGQTRIHRVKVDVARANVSLADLAELPVPLPPRGEQERICAELRRHVSSIEAAELQIARNLIRCQRLRQSILKWAFEGKLADQDPDDEPASVLLERIRADRAAAAEAPRRRRGRGRKAGPQKELFET